MDLLTPKLKLGVLKGISNKMRSPLKEAQSLKQPQAAVNVNERLERKINPDYKFKPKFDLNKKLF